MDEEKAFDKVQHPFMIKTFSKVGIEGAFLNMIKAIYEKPIANIIVKGKNKSFPLKIRSKTRVSSFTILTQHHSYSTYSSHSDQTRKRNRKHPNWKGESKTVIICRQFDSVHRKPYSLHQKTTRPYK